MNVDNSIRECKNEIMNVQSPPFTLTSVTFIEAKLMINVRTFTTFIVNVHRERSQLFIIKFILVEIFNKLYLTVLAWRKDRAWKKT